MANYSIGSANREIAKKELAKSIENLDRGIHQYFRKRLRMKSAWRAFEAFRHSCVYLDIESDGGMRGDAITTIGLYDGKTYQCLVKGEDLENFRDIISNYSMIVTFFGAGFDIPMLQRRFPTVPFDHIHLDLCPTLRQLGYKGGLKKLEKEFGISRPEETEGLNGMDAVRLWRSYLRGDDKALEVLIAYNREDVVNLERLAVIAYEKHKSATFGVFQPSLF